MQSREFRVFISSTFRDMHEERDHLNEVIFPEIRQICRERGVEFVPVDLRWGISESQSSRGDTLRICLEEIERSSPFFIGLLGDRYGWVPKPEESGVEALDTESSMTPLVNEALLAQKSVTEMEFMYGVLRAPFNETANQQQRDAFFYFRAPQEQIASNEAPELKDKLNSLKFQVRQWAKGQQAVPKAEESAATSRLFDGYSSVKALGERVNANLLNVINKRWPESEKPTPLERQRLKHQSFAQSRLQGYIPNPIYLNSLDKHIKYCDHPSRLLVVQGESGIGKSSLLAYWGKKYREQHPDVLFIEHYIGAFGDNSGISILNRLNQELDAKQKSSDGASEALSDSLNLIGEKIGESKSRNDIESLKNKLIEKMSGYKQPIVIVLDALNQLDEESLDLLWLPHFFPDHVRVIVSSLPGQTSNEEAPESRLQLALYASYRQLDNAQFLSVQPLDKSTISDIIDQFSKTYRKHLEPEQQHLIVDAVLCKNPLFLRTLLEEIRLFGRLQAKTSRSVTQEITQLIEGYLHVDVIDDLFEKIIEKREQYFDQNLSGLVKEILCLIWASREGLGEQDLFELLNQDFHNPAYPRVDILNVIRAFDYHFSNRAEQTGRYHFFHGFMTKAVADKYSLTKEKSNAQHYHRKLKDLFKQRFDDEQLDDQVAKELPWQLKMLEAWDELADALVAPLLFEALYENQLELLGYWLSMPKEKYEQLGDRYIQTAKKSDSIEYIIALANFMEFCGQFHYSKDVLDKLLSTLSVIEQNKGGELLNHSILLCKANIARVLVHLGDYGAACNLYRVVLPALERSLGDAHSNTLACMAGCAEALWRLGNYGEARALLEAVLTAKKGALGEDHPDMLTCKGNLAAVLRDLGEEELAKTLLEDVLTVSERMLGETHPYTLINKGNLARVLRDLGDNEASRALLEAILPLLERRLGEAHPSTLACKAGMAAVLRSLGDYEAARALYEEVLSAQEQTLGKAHFDTLTSKANFAGVLQDLGDNEAARDLFEAILLEEEQTLGSAHPKTLTSKHNLAGVLRNLEDYETARDLYEAVLLEEERALGEVHPSTLISKASLAKVLQDLGDHKAARTLYEAVLSAQEQTLGKAHFDTLTSKANFACMLRDSGDYETARTLLEEVLWVEERSRGEEHFRTLTCKGNLASVLQDLGDYEAARALLEEIMSVQVQTLGETHPSTIASKGVLVRVLRDLGDYEAARTLLESVLLCLERSLGEAHPGTLSSKENLACVLRCLGDYEAARTLHEEILSVAERMLGEAHPNTLICKAKLADVLLELEENEAARPLYEELLGVELRTLGAEHEDTLFTKYCLAVVLKNLGEYKAARSLLETVLPFDVRSLGEEHPDTLKTKLHYADVLKALGEFDTAKALYDETLQIRSRTLGKDHPDTIKVKGYLADME